MTDNTPDAPGGQPVPAEHSGDQPQPSSPGGPADAAPSPWAPAGHQPYGIGGQPQQPPQPTPAEPIASALNPEPPAAEPAPATPGGSPATGPASGGLPLFGQPGIAAVGDQETISAVQPPAQPAASYQPGQYQTYPPTGAQPTVGLGYPTGAPPTAGYPQTGGQPAAGYPQTGPQPAAGYPQTGEHAAVGYPPGEQPTVDYSGYAGYAAGPQPTTAIPVGAGGRGNRRTGLIVGAALLALIVGGAAGTVGGYLVSSGNSDNGVVSSLNQAVDNSGASPSAPAGSTQAVANKVLPVVVEIAATFPQTNGADGDTGSGVVISSNGYILTNNHVVATAATSGGTIQVVFSNNKIVNAKVVGRDPTTDIAVIQAQNVSGLPVAQLGDSGALAVGQNVVAIGAPFQLAGTVTSGIVSSLHRPTVAGDSGSSDQTTVLDAIQTDAPINPGNSGGPLVNMSGQIVGINSAIYSPSSSSSSQGGSVGIGFAIPINQAKRTAQQIISTGQATQTVLGVNVADSVPAADQQASGVSNQQPACDSGAIVTNGALIVNVTANGPAAQAGLKAGDVVVGADGRQINSCDGLVAAVHAAAPGDQMKLTLSDGSTVTATLTGQPVKLN